MDGENRKKRNGRARQALNKEKLKSIYAHIAKRYYYQHAFFTAKADQKGRKFLLRNSVKESNEVLDCGSGTGTTGIMAAKKVGPGGRVILFDLSETMLAVAREKVIREGLQDRVKIQSGDMARLAFNDDSFDVVLSTYSLCLLYDPEEGALELLRVTRPGGKIAIAHSIVPENKFVKWLADRIESVAWRFTWLSMGCRAVNVVSVLESRGRKVIFSKHIGVPL